MNKVGTRTFRREMREAEHLAELVHEAFRALADALTKPSGKAFTRSTVTRAAVWASIYGTSTVPARYADPKVVEVTHETCGACGGSLGSPGDRHG